MDFRSPPPPSPTASEPPPSYDSLTPTSGHHPYHCTAHQGTIPSSEQLLHEVSPAAGPQRRQQLVSITEEEADDPPPPPYSPGLRRFLGITNHEYEGTEAPPSYNSLFGQIQHARQQTSDNMIFLKKLCHIILSTIGCTILLVVLTFVPLAILVLGIIYVSDCPLQPLLPIFLIIGGLSGVVKTVLLLCENIVRKNAAAISSRVRHTKFLIGVWRISSLLFNVFVLCWIATGSYWVFSVYHQVLSTDYATCDIVLYKISFSFVTCSYVLLLLIFSWTAFLAITALKKRKRDTRSERGVDDGNRRGSEGDQGQGHVTSAEEGVAQTAVVLLVPLEVVEGVDSASLHEDASVGVEFEGVAAGVGVASGTGVVSNEVTVFAAEVTDEDGTRRVAHEVEEARVQTRGQADNLSRSSPHLDRRHSATSQRPSQAMSSSPHLARHQHPNQTMASSSHLDCHPSVTASSLQHPSASSPHLHQPNVTMATSSSPRYLNVTMASSPHLHQPSDAAVTAPHRDPHIPTAPPQPARTRTMHRFESAPCPFSYQTPGQQSFGYNDMGVVSNQLQYGHSHHAETAVSFSQLQGTAHKDATRPHSISSLCESHSLYLDPTGNSSGRRGNDSTRSSLYNTFHSEGYSITAV